MRNTHLSASNRSYFGHWQKQSLSLFLIIFVVHHFLLCIEETTDVSVTKQLIVYANVGGTVTLPFFVFLNSPMVQFGLLQMLSYNSVVILASI